MITPRPAVAPFLALLILSLAVTAEAGRPHKRTGLALGFGLGGGTAAWDWSQPVFGNANEGSGTGNVRIGGAIRQDLVLGLEASAWAKNYDILVAGQSVGTAKVTFSTTTFAGTWYPGGGGYFVRGGVGLAAAKLEVTFPVGPFDSAQHTDSGVGLLAATGYEWRLTDKFAMGPQVELAFLGIHGGELVGNVLIVDGGLEFNWYW